MGDGCGEVQTLLLAVGPSMVGMQTILTGFPADVMGYDRGLVEDVLFRLEWLELALGARSRRSDPRRIDRTPGPS